MTPTLWLRAAMGLLMGGLVAGCSDDPAPPLPPLPSVTETSLATRIAPPAPPTPLLPTEEEARQAVAEAAAGAAEAGNSGMGYPTEQVAPQVEQLMVDSCWPATPGEAICRAILGNRFQWLRFQRDPQGRWAVAGIAPPPG